MKSKLFTPALLFLAACGTQEQATAPGPPLAPVHPETQEYFGVTVEDPYQYMEERYNQEALDWMKAMAGYAESLFASIPNRDKILESINLMDDKRTETVTQLAITDNDVYFYLKSTPEDETGKLYMRNGYEGEEKLIFDPTDFDGMEDGARYSVSDVVPNSDGSVVALTMAPDGSENETIHLLKPETMEFYPEKIDKCWFPSIAWTTDDAGFYYNQLVSADVHSDGRELNSKVYYHRLGTDPARDQLIIGRGENLPLAGLTEEEFPLPVLENADDVLFIYASTVDNNTEVYVTQAGEARGESPVWSSFTERENEITGILAGGGYAYLMTSKDAPHFKINRVPIDALDLANAEAFIPEPEKGSITDMAVTSDGLFYVVTTNGVEANAFFKSHDGGEVKALDFPVSAGAILLSAKGQKFSEVWMTATGWVTPSTRFRYDPKTDTFTDETMSSKPEYSEFSDVVVREVEVESHDGAMVPVSIIHKKDIHMDGSAPMLVYGYGSYGVNVSPGLYSTSLHQWVLFDGVLAVAHVRGSSAKGNAWHLAGQKVNKPNTWKDLVASTKWLHEQGYSSPKHTTIMGGSAGGILVGRAMEESPETFGVVVAAVGSMNPLRAELTPNGPVNVPEFGTHTIEEEFHALLEMDSYHNLKEGLDYPSVLATAGFNDPRVTYWGPAKFVARAQTLISDPTDIVFKVNYDAGHGQGSQKSVVFEDRRDMYAYALWKTGHPDFQPE